MRDQGSGMRLEGRPQTLTPVASRLKPRPQKLAASRSQTLPLQSPHDFTANRPPTPGFPYYPRRDFRPLERAGRSRARGPGPFRGRRAGPAPHARQRVVGSAGRRVPRAVPLVRQHGPVELPHQCQERGLRRRLPTAPGKKPPRPRYPRLPPRRGRATDRQRHPRRRRAQVEIVLHRHRGPRGGRPGDRSVGRNGAEDQGGLRSFDLRVAGPAHARDGRLLETVRRQPHQPQPERPAAASTPRSARRTLTRTGSTRCGPPAMQASSCARAESSAWAKTTPTWSSWP